MEKSKVEAEQAAAAAAEEGVAPAGEKEIGALRDEFCGKESSEKRQSECKLAIDAMGTVTPKDARTLLPFRLPGFHSRGDLVAYLNQTSSDDGLKLFSRFAANVGEHEAIVLSDVISGLAGRALFAINYAAVVVKSDTADTTARKVVETDMAAVLRMINNGGTITGRFQFPVHATVGPTFQSASSVYFTGGLIGPLGQTDSLSFAMSATAEVMTALSIRDVSEAASFLGDLVLGGRLGWAYSERRIVSTSTRKTLPYAQLAVGLRQNGTIGLSALITWALRDDYRQYTPKLIVNFSAIR